MSSQTLCVVQFVHPGFEYARPQRYPHPGIEPRHEDFVRRGTGSGVMGWKPGKSPHDRKFMLTQGSIFDPDAGRDDRSVPLGFWGEWEGPSVFWRVESPGRPLPKVVHAPFRPAKGPTESVQNTDPMVFGDAFIYSNCLQERYPSLRSLNPGSMVLFGRHAREHGRPSFSLDTCLIVDRLQTLAPAPVDDDSFSTDLLEDAVLGPLYSEGATQDLSVYFGRRYSPVTAGPFSFFPARLMHDSPPLFSRPELTPSEPLHAVINPKKMQGIKVTSHLSVTDRDAIWSEVARQVTRQGCGLGYHASPPPVLSPQAAESAAHLSPLPIRG